MEGAAEIQSDQSLITGNHRNQILQNLNPNRAHDTTTFIASKFNILALDDRHYAATTVQTGRFVSNDREAVWNIVHRSSLLHHSQPFRNLKSCGFVHVEKSTANVVVAVRSLMAFCVSD